MSCFEKVLHSLRSAVDDSAVTVKEDPRHFNNVYFCFQGEKPYSLQQLAQVLDSLESDEDIYQWHSDHRLEITLPFLLEALELTSRIQALFITPEGLVEAVREGACLTGNTFVRALDEARDQKKSLCVLWREPRFWVGCILVCSLEDIEKVSCLPHPEKTLPAIDPEDVSRVVVIQYDNARPRPDLLLPLNPCPIEQKGHAYTALAIAAAVHCVGVLAKETQTDGCILLTGSHTRPVRLTYDPSINLAHFQALQKTIIWVFSHDSTLSERKQIASRELAERIGRGWPENADILATALEKAAHLDEAAEQAYRAYVDKELDTFFEQQQNLITEVKSLTTAFGEKVRELVGALVRDALAGTILTVIVALRILGTGNSGEFEIPDTVFWIIAGLVWIVGLLQVSSVVADLSMSWGEFRHWINRSTVLLSDSERQDLVDRPMLWRYRAVWAALVIVSISYVALGAGIVHFKDIVISVEENEVGSMLEKHGASNSIHRDISNLRTAYRYGAIPVEPNLSRVPLRYWVSKSDLEWEYVIRME